MSYTNPNGHPQGTSRKVTNLLREVMIAELVAINGYQSHILSSNIPEINEAWHHIMLDEKSHYIIALNLLRKYDPVEYKYFMAPHEINLSVNTTQNVQVVQTVPPNQSNRPSNKKSSTSQTNRVQYYDKQLILNNVREDIKGESEAIILYEDDISHIQQKDVRDALQKIIDDEKEHTEHLTQVLLAFDPDPYKP